MDDTNAMRERLSAALADADRLESVGVMVKSDDLRALLATDRAAGVGVGENVMVPKADWDAAYRAFSGAFDTPLARRRQDDEYAQDARKRMWAINEIAASPPAPADASGEVAQTAISAVAAYCARMNEAGKQARFSDLPDVLSSALNPTAGAK